MQEKGAGEGGRVRNTGRDGERAWPKKDKAQSVQYRYIHTYSVSY